MERPSVYLVEKTDALKHALSFFTGEQGGNKHTTATEKRLAFLAQIDFWDWEIDNLMYSFESFKERSRHWDSSAQAMGAANANGFMVKAKVMQKVRWSNFYEKYSYKRNTKTVAPHEILNETIELWNHLLDIVEKDLLDPNAVNYARAGMIPDLKTDMNKYRKKHVELDSLPT